VGCKRSRSNCYEEAQRVCPDGFDVLDGSSSSRGGMLIPSGDGAIFATTYRGDMLIRCEQLRERSVVERDVKPANTGKVTIRTTDAPRTPQQPIDGEDPYQLGGQ